MLNSDSDVWTDVAKAVAAAVSSRLSLDLPQGNRVNLPSQIYFKSSILNIDRSARSLAKQKCTLRKGSMGIDFLQLLKHSFRRTGKGPDGDWTNARRMLWHPWGG